MRVDVWTPVQSAYVNARSQVTAESGSRRETRQEILCIKALMFPFEGVELKREAKGDDASESWDWLSLLNHTFLQKRKRV